MLIDPPPCGREKAAHSGAALFDIIATRHLRGSQKGERLLFLQTALLGAGSGISYQQQGADDARADDVHDSSRDALGEDQVDGFLIDEDVEHRSHHHPCHHVTDDLDEVEGEDILAFEFPFFHLGAVEGETEDEARYAGCDHPAPPGGTVLDGITERMSDEGNEGAGDGTEQRGEERAQPIGGLEAGFGNGGRNLDIHE